MPKRPARKTKSLSASHDRIRSGARPERIALLATSASADGLSTRSAVIGCIRALTGDPELEIEPEMTMGGLKVNRVGLGTCLNTRLSLVGDDQYSGDQIGSDWMVQDVINDADGRRHKFS